MAEYPARPERHRERPERPRHDERIDDRSAWRAGAAGPVRRPWPPPEPRPWTAGGHGPQPDRWEAPDAGQDPSPRYRDEPAGALPNPERAARRPVGTPGTGPADRPGGGAEAWRGPTPGPWPAAPVPRRSSGWFAHSHRSGGPRRDGGRHPVRVALLAGLGVLALVVAGIVVVGHGGPRHPARAAGSLAAGLAPPASESASAGGLAEAHAGVSSGAPAAEVVYSCTGRAPDGVDITYGPADTSLTAAPLPFTARTALDASVREYSVAARLEAAGEVTCRVTVTDPDAGRPATSSGTAHGTGATARADLCGEAGIGEGWQPC